MTDPTSRLLRIADVMRLLSVGRTTVYKLIREGKLAVVKVGRSTRFCPDRVKAFIQSGGA